MKLLTRLSINNYISDPDFIDFVASSVLSIKEAPAIESILLKGLYNNYFRHSIKHPVTYVLILRQDTLRCDWLSL